jgi:hypothetical protein
VCDEVWPVLAASHGRGIRSAIAHLSIPLFFWQQIFPAAADKSIKS